MTTKAVEWALKQDGITSSAKLVLVMLADCINRQHVVCFPSQKRIASVVKLSSRQVRTHLRALEDASLIKCVPGAGYGRGKGRTTDSYYLACDHNTGASRPLTGGAKLPPVNRDTGGDRLPPVSKAKRVTGGSPASLQAEVQRRAYIEEPESEPEESRSNERDSLFADEELGEARKPKPKASKPKDQPTSKPKAKRKTVQYAPEFTAIWQAWPANRRANSDKRKAFERWQAGVEEFGADALQAAVKRYLADPETRKLNFRYCNLVEVFMNGKLEAAVEAVRGVSGSTDAHKISPEVWERGLSSWRERRQWISVLGPNPDHPHYKGPDPFARSR